MATNMETGSSFRNKSVKGIHIIETGAEERPSVGTDATHATRRRSSATRDTHRSYATQRRIGGNGGVGGVSTTNTLMENSSSASASGTRFASRQTSFAVTESNSRRESWWDNFTRAATSGVNSFSISGSSSSVDAEDGNAHRRRRHRSRNHHHDHQRQYQQQNENFVAVQIPTRSFFDATMSQLRNLNGTSVVLVRTVFMAGTSPIAHGEIAEFNRKVQSRIRSRVQHLRQMYEPVTGICIAYPQVVLYVVESTENVVAKFFSAVKTLTTVPISHLKGIRRGTLSHLPFDANVETILTNLRVLSASSNIRGRSFPSWSSKSFNVAKPNKMTRELEFVKECVQILSLLETLGRHVTAKAKEAAAAKTMELKQKINANALEFKAVSAFLPPYDVLATLHESELTETDSERCRFMESLIEKKRSSDEADKADKTFPFYWNKMRVAGVPCTLQGMKDFPEVVATS